MASNSTLHKTGLALIIVGSLTLILSGVFHGLADPEGSASVRIGLALLSGGVCIVILKIAILRFSTHDPYQDIER